MGQFLQDGNVVQYTGIYLHKKANMISPLNFLLLVVGIGRGCNIGTGLLRI